MNNKSIVFDVGLFLVYVANAIIAVPSLRKDFEEFYNTDKFRFYEKAKFSQYYNHDNISEQTLASEVAMRRAYGILLCAEEDESVREFVYNKLLNTDGCFEELVKNPTQADINAFAKKLSKYTAKTNNETTAPTFFLAYLLYVKFGTDTDNEAVKRCLAQTHEIFWIANTRKKELWNNIFRYSESNGTALPKTMRPVIRNLRFGFDIANFTKFFNSVTATKLELYHIIKTYCDSGNEELIDMLKASKVADIATMIMQAMGVSLDEICGCIDISKNEQDMVIKAIAHNSYESLIVAGKKVPFNKVDVTSYFTAHIFMIMAKEYRNYERILF